MIGIKKKIIKTMITVFSIGMICSGLFCLMRVDAQAAAYTLKVSGHNDYSQTFTLSVTGKAINYAYVSTARYEGSDVNYIIDKDLKKVPGTNRWEKTFTLKKSDYGNYKFKVSVGVDNSFYDKTTSSVDVVYKFDGIGIGNKYGDKITTELSANEDYKVTKNGNRVHGEVFLKPGETIQAGVVYHAGFPGSVAGYTHLSWGGKSISGSGSSQKTGGFYHSYIKYNVSSSVDYEGPLTATYSYKGKSGSKSLGVTVKVDGTKPKVKIDSKYASGGTKYVNKTTSVPVTIEEKNFDSSKTTVLINGRNTSVSWSGGGTTHTANVPLREGKNVIEVYSTDKAGNRSETAKSAEIIVDKKAPKVQIIGFGNGTGKGLKNGEVVKYPLKVVISDETKLGSESVKLYKMNDDGKGKSSIQLTRDGSGKKVTYFIDDISEDGYYTLDIKVKDRAGNNVAKNSVKSEGKTPYKVSGGGITGGFTVNRKGSLYQLENEQIFQKPINQLDEIVVYEYNKNKIIKNSVTIINSTLPLPVTLTDQDYKFESVPTDKSEYNYKYKYTISGKIFNEGRYNIEISSESIAGKNGNSIARTVESNSLNKAIIIDKVKPEVISFNATDNGEFRVKIRDDYIDINSVYIQIGDEKTKLKKDEDDSTSTNVVFTGNVKGNISNAKLVCKDIAGNTQESTEIEIQKSSVVSKILLYGGLAFGAIILIVGAIVTILVIKKKK